MVVLMVILHFCAVLQSTVQAREEGNACWATQCCTRDLFTPAGQITSLGFCCYPDLSIKCKPGCHVWHSLLGRYCL